MTNSLLHYFLVFHLLFFSLASESCGKDEGKNLDQGSGIPVDQTSLVDRGNVADQPSSMEQGIPTNSGLPCKTKETCAPYDECIVAPGSWSKRMCLSYCTPGKECLVPDRSKNASQCMYPVENPETKTLDYYCVWFCLFHGKAYSCPNSEDFDCIAVPFSGEKDVKVCIPK
jgi:hypothetical protein